MSKLAYFAGDGNYGLENGNFILCDVSKWTEYDWEQIEIASDYDRPRIALAISLGYDNAN